MPRASVEVAYSRRSFSGFTVNDNTSPRNRTTRPTASSRRSIHGCRAAAATRSSGLFDVVPDALRADPQQRHRLAPVRQHLSVLQRRRHLAERPDRGRVDDSGRHQHRTERRGRVRGQREPARAHPRHRRRPGRLQRQHRRARTATSPTACSPSCEGSPRTRSRRSTSS